MNRDSMLDRLAMNEDNVTPERAALFGFSVDEYHQRRTELINEPDDSEAPEWATHKEHTSGGVWLWIHVDKNGDHLKYCVASRGKVPAGHRWQETLTRINRDDNTSTPEEEEEFERIQARQDADKPHEADARRLDAQFAEAMGKQPRYLDATGEDWIDEFARTATLDEFRGAMRFTIGKYNRRVGRKDEVLKEVRKMKDYCARWEAYEVAFSAKERGE